MPPAVSVCIPAYNGERFLAEALESVLGQTYTDFEVVVVDDSSTDNTVAVVGRFMERDSRIRLARNPVNLGLVSNWNRCVDLARGEWVKFLFQDDVLLPDCLQEMIAAGQEHDFIVCERDFSFEADVPAKTRRFFLSDVRRLSTITPSGGYLPPRLISHIVGVFPTTNVIGEPTSTLIRKSLFNKIGLFDTGLLQIGDYEFWARAGTSVGIYYLPRRLARFRVHAHSATSKQRSSKAFQLARLDYLLVLDRYLTARAYTALRGNAPSLGFLRLRHWYTLIATFDFLLSVNAEQRIACYKALVSLLQILPETARLVERHLKGTLQAVPMGRGLTERKILFRVLRLFLYPVFRVWQILLNIVFGRVIRVDGKSR